MNDDPTFDEDTDQGDIAYCEQVMWCWAVWANGNAVRLGYPEAGNIWGLSKPAERKWYLNLTDDHLLMVDRIVVKLPWRPERKLIWLHFFSRRPKRLKCQYYALSGDEYDAKIEELLARIYAQLRPSIDSWPGRASHD